MGLNLLNYHVDIGSHSLEQAAERLTKALRSQGYEQTLPDGNWVMIARFPDFPIPEGIRENYGNEKTYKQADEELYARQMTVCFTISGDETIRGKVRVHLMPLNDDKTVLHYGYNVEFISRKEFDAMIKASFSQKSDS